MASTLYALLVGINDYAPDVGKLDGCLNDVEHFRDYLNSSFDTRALAIEVLKDSDATRDNIVLQFRTHLGRATEADAAVFLYCGHGARWAAAREFKEFYPDGKDEGLVCYDSRRQNGAYPFNLADKELAVLLAEVAARAPHLTVILDCCHSGSGTRDVDAFTHLKVRQTHEVFSERPLASYIDGYYVRRRDSGLPLSIPRSRHVLLAACDRHEKALEREDRSGLFTSTLLAVASASGAGLTYADLFVRCRALIRQEAQNQTPQFEAFEHFNAASGFLGRPATPSDRRFRVHFDTGAWTLDAGAIHGVPADRAASVTLYHGANPAHSTGMATTIEVGLEKSLVQLEFPGDPSLIYNGEITSFPDPPMLVHFAGDTPVIERLEGALRDDRSAQVAFTDIPNGAVYSIIAEDGRWLLKHRELDLLIQGVAVKDPPQADAATTMVRILRHVARWEHGLALQNSRTRMEPSQLDFVFAEWLEGFGEHVYPESEDIVLDYAKSGTGWKEVRGRFKVRNRMSQPVHVVLAYFSPSYGIHMFYNDRIDPGDGYVTMWGDAADDYFWLDGDIKHSSIEEFKLFVSTEPVDAFSLSQDDLTLGQIVAPAVGRAVGHIKPMQRLVHRNEWFAKHIRITIVRRVDQVSARDAAVAHGAIVIKGHPSVTANVSVSGAKRQSRSVKDGSDFYQAFEQQGLALIDFTDGHGDSQSVLELTDIQNAGSLSAIPLEIELRVPLKEDEGILPVVFDGQHVAVGGQPYKDDSGHTRISIDHIPDLPKQRRSLGGSLKLYFFKTQLRRCNINRLRWVEYKSDGSFEYHPSMVADRVAASRNILLLVHGIIGDTEGMARGVRACGLDRRFDLVLTYDYENLSTPITQTAQMLETQLAAAGLRADDDKKLTLLAHSMGGLVSRWFIEREGGHAVVDRLVMCGTPNQGSPFGRVDEARRILTVLTSLALNYIPAAIPFSSAALMLLNRSKKLTPTLEQMNPSSEFITTLNMSDDPGVLYTILAGDVSGYDEPADPFFAKMLTKAGQGFSIDALFAHQAHDIAAGVDSILGVHDRRPIGPARQTVACHHLNYFMSAAGRSALTSVEW